MHSFKSLNLPPNTFLVGEIFAESRSDLSLAPTMLASSEFERANVQSGPDGPLRGRDGFYLPASLPANSAPGTPHRVRALLRVDNTGAPVPVKLLGRPEPLSGDGARAYAEERSKQFSELPLAQRLATEYEWTQHLRPTPDSVFVAGQEHRSAYPAAPAPAKLQKTESKFANTVIQNLPTE